MKHSNIVAHLEDWLGNERRQLELDQQELETLGKRESAVVERMRRREENIDNLRSAIAALRGEEEA